MSLRYHNAVLRYLSRNEYTHREDIAELISDYFDQNPNCTLKQFTRMVKSIRRDFFRINRINREDFSRELLDILSSLPRHKMTTTAASSTLEGKIDELGRRIDEGHERILDKLVKIDAKLESSILSSTRNILGIIKENLGSHQYYGPIESSDVLQDIRYKLLRKRQENQTRLLESLDVKLSRLLHELQTEESKKNKFLQMIRDLGTSITSDIIAALILKLTLGL